MQTLPDDLAIFTTADGSPTLAFARGDGYVEKMHHSGGALSESLYIYQQALAITLEEKLAPRVLSVGLGLGYNELISLAEFDRSKIADFKIWSFEALPILQNAFRIWAGLESEIQVGQGSKFESNSQIGAAVANPESSPIHSLEHTHAVSEVVATVAAQVAREMKIDVEKLKQCAKEALENKNLELLGAYPEALPATDKINTVYYDAYSNKMDTGLWSEETLTGRLGPCLDRRCVFATYAATGILNRSLKKLGFRLIPKAGFKGKRESTLAIRNIVR